MNDFKTFSSSNLNPFEVYFNKWKDLIFYHKNKKNIDTMSLEQVRNIKYEGFYLDLINYKPFVGMMINDLSEF